MQQVLLVIHLILALAIILTVLLQRSEGGGLVSSSGGGMGGLMGTRSTANLLSRTTAILAGCFMLTSLSLAYVAGKAAPEASLMDTLAADVPAAVEEVVDNAQDVKEEIKDAAPSAPISE